jgi:rubrerythrin
MDISLALHSLDDLEGNLASAYDTLSQRFAQDLPLTQLFGRLSTEEAAHRNLIQYQLRLVMQSPHLFKDTQVNALRLSQAVLAAARFKAEAGRYTAEQAVRAALIIEGDASETYFKSIVIESHPDSARFIQAMAGDCMAHAERLRTLAAERGWWKPPKQDPKK